MTGVSGTSHTGKKHAYYRCVGRKNGCKQESVQKDLLEETVVQHTFKLLDDKLIDQISQALYEILQGELKNGNVPRLEKLLASNKKASENLMQLLMDGKAKNTILDKLEQLEKERKEIELQLETEKSEILDYTLEDLRYYVKRFKHLDYTKTENRQALIDTFVNKVFYYGDKKGKVRYNVTDFSTGSLYERVVELRGVALQREHTGSRGICINLCLRERAACRGRSPHRAAFSLVPPRARKNRTQKFGFLCLWWS